MVKTEITEKIESFLIGDDDLGVELTDMIANHADGHTDRHTDDTY